MRRNTSELLMLTALVVSAAVGFFFYNPPQAIAGPTQSSVMLGGFYPVLADPARGATSTLGATGETAIADPSSTAEGNYQRLVVTNASPSAKLCVFWVASAGSCSGASKDCDVSGTDDGDLVLPTQSRSFTVGGDLRTCWVGSASPTLAHISRSLTR